MIYSCRYHVSLVSSMQTLRGRILNQVEDSHPVPHGREEVGAIGAVEQIALAVNSAQQV